MGVHVRPVGDVIEHEWEDCWCGPDQKLELTDHGDEWIFVHHSADGRELTEAS